MKDLGRLVRGLDEGFDVFALHPPGSPEYRAIAEELKRALVSIWRRAASVTLDLEGESFLCDVGGLPVVAGAAPGLAAVLRRGRVRSLRLEPGSEEAEVEEFLRAANRSGTLGPTDSDDLTTMLWDVGFEHVAYEVDSPDVDGDQGRGGDRFPAQPARPGEARERSRRIREDVRSPQRPTSLVDTESFDSTLYFLEEHEIEYLKSEVDREYDRSLGRSVVSLLLDTFEVQKAPHIRAEVVDVLDGILPHLLGDGDLTSVGYLAAEVDDLVRKTPDLPPDERWALGALAQKLSEPEALNQLFQLMDEAPTPPRASDLTRLLEHLGPEAFPTFLRWQRFVRADEVRAVLGDSLAAVADAKPSLLSAALESTDRVVVDGALRLMTTLKRRECVGALRALSSFPDSGVRRSLVDTLSAVGGSACCGELVHMMSDEDAEVRVASVRALADRRYRHALPHLQDVLRQPELSDRDLIEQRALFEAYGGLAGAEGVDFLAPILLGKGRTGRRSADIRACAAVALGLVGAPRARETLRKAERDADPVVRNAVTRALRLDV
jgi:hypothetical protein